MIERNTRLLRAAARRLAHDGLMFVYGLPSHLARYATALSEELAFRYWIAVRAMTAQKEGGLRPEHMGLALFSGPGATINRVRTAHPRCRCCGETLKDWGGKSHLMRSDGVALSDVWMDIVVDPRERVPSEVFERILQMVKKDLQKSLLVLAPAALRQGELPFLQPPVVPAFDPLRWKASGHKRSKPRAVPDEMIDRLHNRPCLEVLRRIPSETVDLAFADPPFNLTKSYNGYSDDLGETDYMGWCKRWLTEYRRVVKPGGAIIILNLPRWSFRLADFLSRTRELYLQNWIVWNSLPEPKGVLMPAHYSLLYFTKGERASHFNYCSMERGWEPFDEAVFPPDRADVCNRRSCILKRRSSAQVWRGELTDIWHDIHRVRRSKKGAPDYHVHPCRTPEMLVDRIIRLTTTPGDLVLDAFAGVGTTALIARRLGRRFIAIEQDSSYLDLAERRMTGRKEFARREKAASNRSGISRRRLQLELRRLALELGRMPTKADVENLSIYDLDAYERAFKSWAVALKAARAAVCDASANIGPAEIDLLSDPIELNTIEG
ncbi:MAG TPA: site-specific DNA-methyltransferase [Blastocatellia bacterium]|nr:site-specific DNA-methyltransferase [Blastocatellia bacterium]